MKRLLLLGALAVLAVAAPDGGSLEQGFRNPPMSARPHVYWLWLNGYVDPATARSELQAMKDAGIGGVLLFDMGARGDASAQPPAGPAFLNDAWMRQMKESVDQARGLGLQVDFSVVSSWDLGGHWIKPEHGSMGLYTTETTVRGGKAVDVELPFPAVPREAPRAADGKPAFWRDVSVLAVRDAKRRPGHEFVLRLDPDGLHDLREVVLDNGEMGAGVAAALASTMTPVKEFSVAVSTTGINESDFREVLRGTLKAGAGPQKFALPAGTKARDVRLRLLSGQEAGRPRWMLGDVAVYDAAGVNVAASRLADSTKNGAVMLRYPEPLSYGNEWNLDNLNDGDVKGPRGLFAPSGLPAFELSRPEDAVELAGKVGADGHLRWEAPAGEWTILRYVCMNTGEKLKVPSPASDGLATDHFRREATAAHMDYVIERLKATFGQDLKKSGLGNLYLASYEVKGPVWSVTFADEFRKRRGYDMRPYLPVIFGGKVRDDDTTERFMFDYRKTLGEVLVDAYYNAARESAHKAGLGIKSEAGGPGPPVHNVPVDSLLANAAVDEIQGEFWPYWPKSDSMWVIKEPASAAHVYGKKTVHLESFTSFEAWREGPQDLKDSADRMFIEGGNHVVWHTWTHNPPEAGLPGWAYLAGTHLNRNVTWWPKARPFLDYLSRSSFLLQQGKAVADVLYYYGDGGYKFIGPRKDDPSYGRGYDYDFANSDVILNRLSVKHGRIVLPDGMSYAALVLPESDEMHPAVLAKIESLVKAGAVVVGPKPRRAVGLQGWPASDKNVQTIAGRLWGEGKGKVSTKPLREVLPMEPDFVAPEPLEFVHRRDGESDIYFVRNRTDQPVEKAVASFRVAQRQPELWDPVTGSTAVAGGYRAAGNRMEVPVSLPARGSVFVVFRRAASGAAPALRDTAPTKTFDVSSTGWSMKFQAGRGAPAELSSQTLGSWTASAEPDVKYFAGTARYRTSFDLPAGWKAGAGQTMLDLGKLWTIGEAWLNGKPLGVTWTAPFRLDCTAALREGRNELEVEVTNVWLNRLIGDSLLPAGSAKLTKTNVTTSGGKPYRALEPVPSGLFGPVRVVQLRP